MTATSSPSVSRRPSSGSTLVPFHRYSTDSEGQATLVVTKDLIPLPKISCPHGFSFAKQPEHVEKCKCMTRSDNVILASYLAYIDDPNPETEEDYLTTKHLLSKYTFHGGFIDGISLKDDDNRYAPWFLLSSKDSWKSGKSEEEIKEIEEKNMMEQEAAFRRKYGTVAPVVRGLAVRRKHAKLNWEAFKKRTRLSCEDFKDRAIDQCAFYFGERSVKRWV